MDSFLENAQRILDVASAASPENDQDLAVLILPDGGLHILMESTFSLEAAAAYAGAESAYRVTRSRTAVKVAGKTRGRDCVLEQRNVRDELFRDQALYLLAPPTLAANATKLLRRCTQP